MIYELRVYEVLPEQLPKLHDRFANHTMKLFEKHGMTNVGYWVTDAGGSNHELTYLLAFEDANARVEAWKNFRAGPTGGLDNEMMYRHSLMVAGFGIRALIIGGYALDKVT